VNYNLPTPIQHPTTSQHHHPPRKTKGEGTEDEGAHAGAASLQARSKAGRINTEHANATKHAY